MNFKYSSDFAQALKDKVEKPGVRIFLVESLVSLEKELQNRTSRFLRSLNTGQSVMIALEEQGRVQIARGEGGQWAPRFMIRFVNAPQYVFLATCEPEGYESLGEVAYMGFIAVVKLGDESDSGPLREDGVRRM